MARCIQRLVSCHFALRGDDIEGRCLFSLWAAAAAASRSSSLVTHACSVFIAKRAALILSKHAFPLRLAALAAARMRMPKTASSRACYARSSRTTLHHQMCLLRAYVLCGGSPKTHIPPPPSSPSLPPPSRHPNLFYFLALESPPPPVGWPPVRILASCGGGGTFTT